MEEYRFWGVGRRLKGDGLRTAVAAVEERGLEGVGFYWDSRE